MAGWNASYRSFLCCQEVKTILNNFSTLKLKPCVHNIVLYHSAVVRVCVIGEILVIVGLLKILLKEISHLFYAIFYVYLKRIPDKTFIFVKWRYVTIMCLCRFIVFVYLSLTDLNFFYIFQKLLIYSNCK